MKGDFVDALLGLACGIAMLFAVIAWMVSWL